jgi:anti-sigma B factor antagonist
MDLNPRRFGEVVVVSVPAANLDFGNVADFKRSLEPALAEHRALVLDLQRVEFIDSLGLGAILSALRKVGSRGGDLRVSGVTPAAAAVMRLVRLDQIIESFKSETEAVDSFG